MFPSDSDFEAQFTFETGATPSAEEPPFHIFLLGDWSGRDVRSDLSNRRPLMIDRDNFDEVIRKLKVGLELDLQNDRQNILSLEFTELDDFHPDNLFRQVSLFSDLRDVRRRLLNDDTFDQAADEVRSWFPQEEDQTNLIEEKPSINVEPPLVGSGNLLDQILSQPTEGTAVARSQTTQSKELSSFLRQIVSPHLVQTDETEQTKLLGVVDEATSELMRQILHHPQFQALESAWRGLYFLVRRVETDVDLKIYLFDISKSEISDDLKSVSDLKDSVPYRWLVRETIETPGGEPVSVIGGNYTFGLNVEDIATLIRLAQLSQVANAPFISHILPEMFGIQNITEMSQVGQSKPSDESNESKLWLALRSIPEAEYLGLSLTRFLSRLPFGDATDTTETFSFEEFTDELKHQNFLWSNPCFACALLLAQSYRVNGWEMGQALNLDIEKLPVYLYQVDGETKTKPCAEILLTENLAEKILEQSLMFLISFRDTDRVRLSRFQSVSFPPTNLKGRWNS